MLWTRNALERMGVNLVDSAEITIKIDQEAKEWEIQFADETVKASSVEEMLQILLS